MYFVTIYSLLLAAELNKTVAFDIISCNKVTDLKHKYVLLNIFYQNLLYYPTILLLFLLSFVDVF